MRDENDKWPIWLLILVLFALMLGSCTKTIYVDKPVVKTEYRDRVRVDSLVVHDSVFQETIIKGDTVTRYKYVYRDVYHDKIIRDTIATHDTIAAPYPVEKVVARMNTWQTFFYWFGLCMFLCVAGYIGFKIWRKNW